jgi:hypothetical protein
MPFHAAELTLGAQQPRWGKLAGSALACESSVASHRLVSRRFLLPRQGKSHVQSRDRTGGTFLFTFQLRSGQPRTPVVRGLETIWPFATVAVPKPGSAFGTILRLLPTAARSVLITVFSRRKGASGFSPRKKAIPPAFKKALTAEISDALRGLSGTISTSRFTPERAASSICPVPMEEVTPACAL